MLIGTLGREAWTMEECAYCFGHGACIRCDGRGDVAGGPCPECSGSGQCPECGGRGIREPVTPR